MHSLHLSTAAIKLPTPHMHRWVFSKGRQMGESTAAIRDSKTQPASCTIAPYTYTFHFLEEPPEFFKEVVCIKGLHAQDSSWAAPTHTTLHPEFEDNHTIQNLKASTFQYCTWMHWSFNWRTKRSLQNCTHSRQCKGRRGTARLFDSRREGK